MRKSSGVDLSSNCQQNLIFSVRNQAFRPFRSIKPSIFWLSTTCRCQNALPDQKNVTFFVILLARGDLSTSPIDRARSQLPRTFFPASVRFIQRPKRPHLFLPFFTILAFSPFLRFLSFFIFFHHFSFFGNYFTHPPPFFTLGGKKLRSDVT